MNFSQLQSLVALAEQGNFTEAAYRVNLTQSAVSHALASLEDELRVSLLERNRKGIVALTPVGQRIMPHVRMLLAQAEAIQQEAKAAQGLATGKVRLGSVNSFWPELLASILNSFKRRYPDLEVVLFEGTLEEVYEWIGSSLVDAGFVLHPAKGLESKLITNDELYVVVPTSHHLHSQQVVSGSELDGESFIMAKSLCSCQLIEMAGLAHLRPQIRYQASDSATIMAMVREGLGITLMPGTMLSERMEGEGVVALPFEPARYLEIGLAVRSQATASRGAKLFIQIALEWTKTQREPRLHSPFVQPAG